jgi:hypothetical protein
VSVILKVPAPKVALDDSAPVASAPVVRTTDPEGEESLNEPNPVTDVRAEPDSLRPPPNAEITPPAFVNMLSANANSGRQDKKVANAKILSSFIPSPPSSVQNSNRFFDVLQLRRFFSGWAILTDNQHSFRPDDRPNT